MNKNTLTINKNSWEEAAARFYGRNPLPEYGPLAPSEDELNLFGEVQGSAVLDIGCGSGHSLLYMSERRVKELWGLEFQFRTITLYSRLIEGNYPNIESLLPKEARTVLTLKKEFLKQGIDRASLFASASDNNKVLLEVIEGLQLKICSSSTEYGEIAEVQDIVSLKGESELSVTVDGNFMMDALKAIGEDEVQLSYSGSMKPLLLQAMDSGMQFHLISPVRTA